MSDLQMNFGFVPLLRAAIHPQEEEQGQDDEEDDPGEQEHFLEREHARLSHHFGGEGGWSGVLRTRDVEPAGDERMLDLRQALAFACVV
jgi:hypothetical protein